MKVFLIFSLFFLADIDANSVQDQLSLLLPGRKYFGPEKDEVLDECNDSTHSSPDGGIISSPNYPGNYSDNLSCTYLIDLGTSADTVLFKFLDFQTEEGYDFVLVYDGPSADNYRLLLNASGSTIPPPVIWSSKPQMFIKFTTNNNSHSGYRGFLATYSNRRPTGCGKTYTDLTGNITSIHYPENYSNNLYCEYVIDLQSMGVSTINLTFLDFSSELAVDYVYVYDGLSSSSYLNLQWTGNEIPPSVASRTSQMLVRFTTDRSIVSKGFFATYVAY